MKPVSFDGIVVSNVISINDIFYRKGSSNVRKSRETWAIILKYEGKTVYTTENGQKILSDRTHPVLLPRGVSYRWECVESGHFLDIEFDAAIPDVTDSGILNFSLSSAEKILKAVNEYESVRFAENDFLQIRAKECVYRVLYELFANDFTPVYADRALKNRLGEAVRYILSHYAETPDNAKLASICHMSVSYFRKTFSAVYGIPPAHYVTKIRMEKARELLLSDYEKIEDVAFSVGYENVYHFSKAFRNYYGTSPAKYRAQQMKSL